jgi:hypothetical protein
MELLRVDISCGCRKKDFEDALCDAGSHDEATAQVSLPMGAEIPSGWSQGDPNKQNEIGSRDRAHSARISPTMFMRP